MGATRDITPERNATEQELQQYETAHNRIQKLDTSNTCLAGDALRHDPVDVLRHAGADTILV